MTGKELQMGPQAAPATGSGMEVAIVGMAARLPGARNISEYWENLRSGAESLTRLTDEELRRAGVAEALLRDPLYVKAGMFLRDMEWFDAQFFGLSSKDASIMDPQHRHFLECAWEALEHAGHDPTRFEGAIGVFAGSGHNAYLGQNLLTNERLLREVGFFLLRHTGNDKDFLATRVSYHLDLKGPSVNVQTACSTSLVAVHLACQSLLSGECDMALAGGVTIELPHRQGYLYREGEILSPDGHCRPFDRRSSGTVFGSGVGIVVLRRLADALASGDRVHAIIRGSAVNNDGSRKVSYLAPSVDGQLGCVAEAISLAGVPVESIGLIEAHGTGTALGDPIEVAALSEVFRRQTGRRQFCALGSVKSNIGHLDTAAGAASLIKAVLALEHRQIPPTLHFEEENPAIDLQRSPFYVNSRLIEWKADGAPRRAGVTSLGVGGTNAHVVLEEAPVQESQPAARPCQILPLSARTPQALEDRAADLAEHLREQRTGGVSLADVAFTLQTGRQAMAHRSFVVASDLAEAIAALSTLRETAPATGVSGAKRPVAFLFSGGGAHYPGMAAGLYAGEPAFREAVDECVSLLGSRPGFDLRSLLYPTPEGAAQAAAELARPSRALIALFVTQYAQARLWRSLGIHPAALLGHSMGENTAACLAGVISLKDALGLVLLRGQLFEKVEPGGMLSVALPADALSPLIEGGPLGIAVVNAPSLTVVSGPRRALAALAERLTEREIEHQRVHIDVAAHSAMLDPILDEFGRYLSGIELRAPEIPILSNLTGTWLTDAQARDPRYFVRHLRETVRMAECMATLLRDPGRILLEVGPGRVMTSLASMQPGFSGEHLAIPSLGPRDEPGPDARFLLHALGRLWQAGVEVPWHLLHGEKRLRVPLPTYPFQRARHFIEPGKARPAEASDDAEAELLRREDPAEWFYEHRFARSPLPVRGEARLEGRVCLVISGERALGLPESLARAGARVILARPGARFAHTAPATFTLRPDAREDYEMLLRTLSEGSRPTDIIHLLCAGDTHGPGADPLSAARSASFDSLLSLAKALASEDPMGPLRLTVISTDMQQVAGEPVPAPIKGMLLGILPVIASEIDGVSFQSIDLQMEERGSWQEGRSAARVLGELACPTPDEVVAYRGHERFVRRLGRLRLPEAESGQLGARVRDGGVYLITGGLGGLGLLCAETLARCARVRLALIGRTALPPRSAWGSILARQGGAGPQAERIRRILAIEASGAEVMVESADVARIDQMAGVLAAVHARFGAPNGVIHAAGVLDDELLQLKTPESVEAVLRPKLLGTLVLDQLLQAAPLDFFVLFSSVSAFAGLPGQADYAAANAFLDAFARHRTARSGGFTVAIGWSAWKEIGMVAARGGEARGQVPLRRTDHPLLDACLEEGPARAVYSTEWSVPGQWVLGEHRVRGGGCVIPGAGYLEIARAAFADRFGPGAVEIAEVFFMAPFSVMDGERRALEVVLLPREQGCEFVMQSGAGATREEHVRGAISRIREAPFVRHDIAHLLSRCHERVQRFSDPDHHPHMEFGARWECLRRLDLGRGEALATLELDPAHAAELQTYRLHPALIDMAAASASALIDGYDAARDFYVPVGVGRLRLLFDLVPNLVSHIRYRHPAGGRREHDIAIFDVTIMDTSGLVLCELEELAMKRVGDRAQLAKEGGKGYLRELASEADPAHGRADGGAELLARTLRTAIGPAEGAEALLRVLAHLDTPHVAVATHPLAALIADLKARPEGRKGATTEDLDQAPEVRSVEGALSEHPALRQAAVRAFRSGSGLRLVAYVVFREGQRATVSELRRFVKARCQAAPQHVVELFTLPLRADGAIDKAALADPLAHAEDYVAPRTETERALAAIWQEVLGIPRVSVHDNFFDVGGHSLLSIRAITRTNKQLGVRLNQAMMALQTLEQIGRECERQRTPGAAAEASAPPDRPARAGLLDRLLRRSP